MTGWRKYLLIPRLMVTSLGAPRAQSRAWDRYWSGVTRTGPHGDVLWDAAVPAEAELAASRLSRHADLSRPLVDLGCGSGRQAYALAGLAPRVIGLDGSPAAIAHARATAGPEPASSRVTFRVADVTEPGLGHRLHAELGDTNVHIRGVLHVLDDAGRHAVATNIAALLGERGTLYLCETDHAGDPLDYLVNQGARPTHLPAVVRRLIRAGVSAPRRFSAADLRAAFPPPAWEIVEESPTVVHGVPLSPGGPIQDIPARYAVLRRSP